MGRLPRCRRCGGTVLLEQELDGPPEWRCLMCARSPVEARAITEGEWLAIERAEKGHKLAIAGRRKKRDVSG